MVKKWLALLLAVLMVLSLGATAFAAEGDEEEKEEHTETAASGILLFHADIWNG